jgi:hypothetical protein
MNELMLIISTISSVLAGVTALAGEMRAQRRNRHRERSNLSEAAIHEKFGSIDEATVVGG